MLGARGMECAASTTGGRAARARTAPCVAISFAGGIGAHTFTNRRGRARRFRMRRVDVGSFDG